MKIRGTRGDWTAEVDGRRLAVLHSSWMQGLHDYHDPDIGAERGSAKYAALMECLRGEDWIVMQRDADATTMARNGYVGIFAFENLAVAEDGSFSLRLTRRVADPKD
jgi:hypothetical protein